MMHSGEYGRAISMLEGEVSNEGRSLEERTEYCRWLAECHQRIDDQKSAGDWYLEAVKRVLNQKLDNKSKAARALPLILRRALRHLSPERSRVLSRSLPG